MEVWKERVVSLLDCLSDTTSFYLRVFIGTLLPWTQHETLIRPKFYDPSSDPLGVPVSLTTHVLTFFKETQESEDSEKEYPFLPTRYHIYIRWNVQRSVEWPMS